MAVVAAIAVPHPPIILPEIGKGEEKKIQHTTDSYREAIRFAASLKPETLVVLSPHSIVYADYFHISPGEEAEGDFGAFRAPQVKLHVKYDAAFASALALECDLAGVAAGTLGEKNSALDHATMIPLRFYQETGQDCKIVRIGLSGLSALEHYKLGQCIAEAAEGLGRRTVIIASGDLSHKLKEEGPYGFAAEGPVFDRQVTQALQDGAFDRLLAFDPDFCESAAECGLRSFQIMAGAFDRKEVKSRLLSYEGPFGVGYAVATFEVTGDNAERDFGRRYRQAQEQKLQAMRDAEDSYVRLARFSLEHAVRSGERAPLPQDTPQELLTRRAGAFVSLHKDGRLRGCIGTILPTENTLAQEIMQNAISAAERDPRFDPVTPEELQQLCISVDVLSQPEQITSPEQLDVRRYGVIVQSGAKRGLLLPDLPGVDTIAQQIAIAREKGGIREEDEVTLWRFEVTRHH